MDAPAGAAGQSANETAGHRLVGQFFAKPVKGAGKSMPHQAAANRAKFVVDPDRNLQTPGPEKHRSRDKDEITEQREKTQRGTRTPVHANLSTRQQREMLGQGKP